MSDVALPIPGVPGRLLPGPLLSDERLAKLASGGSGGAMAVLYERHHQALYRYCRSIVRNHEDAQDALQSTMTRAFIALRTSERDLAVRPWLFRIAHNEAISILRKRRPNDCPVGEHEPSEASVERTVDQRERLATLVADLQALPERQRAALLMRELNGLSIEEIAEALSVSPGAAKQTLFEARSSLHERAEGRAMECETVRRTISDGDGRVLRSRRIASHLRGCAGCRDFRALIDTRSADLRALAPPLPASTATALLARLIAHGSGGGHAGGAAAASGVALGNHATASLVAKGLVGVVVIATAGAGAIHLTSSLIRPKHAPTRGMPVVVAHSGVADRGGVAVNAAVRGDTRPVTRTVGHGARAAGRARAADGRVGSHAGPGREGPPLSSGHVGPARVVPGGVGPGGVGLGGAGPGGADPGGVGLGGADPGRVSPGRNALASTGAPSKAGRGMRSSATPAAGHRKTGSPRRHGHATGDPRGTSGEAGRGSPKAPLTPREPQQSHRSPPSKPAGPSTSPQPQRLVQSGEPQKTSSQATGPQGGGGDGHSPPSEPPSSSPTPDTGSGGSGAQTTVSHSGSSQATSHTPGGK